MLLGNKEKLVKTHLENVLWGNIKMLSINPENEWRFDKGESRKFMEKLQKWSTLYPDNNESNELKILTNDLYQQIVEYRIVGLLQGQYVDIDHTIEKLTEDNKQLTEHLSQAYIPSSDAKVGMV